MPVTKQPITQIAQTDDVDYTIANAPHADLEANIDALISAVNSGAAGGFEYDAGSSSGLNFAYTSGIYNENGAIISITASTEALTASSTCYVYIDIATNTVSHNTSGFPADGAVPLWEVTTDVGAITLATDKRAVFQYRNSFEKISITGADTGSSPTRIAVEVGNNDELVWITVNDFKNQVDVGSEAWSIIDNTDGGGTAVAGAAYFCDTSTAAFAFNLPSNPSLGDTVSFADYAGTFDTNNLTIGRNTKNIMGLAESMTVSSEWASFTLVYSDVTQGWIIK
jgi:hypothetical protein